MGRSDADRYTGCGSACGGGVGNEELSVDSEGKLRKVCGKSWPKTDVGESFASAAICTCIFVRVLIVGELSFQSFMQ